ncbi:MAG: hypothetical protein K2Z81_17410, partial [Cyanobacteria bacterium]|nr:hypothetical protein [Cyanobacteriota bacterium]
MKRTILTLALAFFAGSACFAQEVTKDEPSKTPAVKVNPAPSVDVDMKKKLPDTIELTVGQEIVFENGVAKINAAETDGKGALLDSRPHDTFTQAGRFKAVREGSGEIKVETSSQGLLTVMKTHTIKVKVVAAPIVPAPKSFDLYGNHPQTIDLKVGEELVFWRDTNKMYIVSRGVTQKTTDGQAGNTLEAQNFTAVIDANGHTKVAVFKAKRAGTA